jgi:hypothetical protein
MPFSTVPAGLMAISCPTLAFKRRAIFRMSLPDTISKIGMRPGGCP